MSQQDSQQLPAEETRTTPHHTPALPPDDQPLQNMLRPKYRLMCGDFLDHSQKEYPNVGRPGESRKQEEKPTSAKKTAAEETKYRL